MFDGVGVAPTDVLVKYTYLGDTNLDGVVDGQDVANLLAGMDGGLTGWVNGDVNYDGVVNGVDFGLMMTSLQNQGASFGASGGTGGSVPEPGMVGVVGMAGAGLGIRRRRLRA